MRLSRFNGDRLGLWEGESLLDASAFLSTLPTRHWGNDTPWADPVIERLDDLAAFVQANRQDLQVVPLNDVHLNSPVPFPSKIIGAPVNYHAHLDEATRDAALNQGARVHPIDEIGLFLKATSALAGPSDPLTLTLPDRRSDHEAEVAVIIGKTCKSVKAADALGKVAGYALAFDISVRGKEDRSMRKSPDGYAVVGPCLVTADEIAHPDALEFELRVNGERRQHGSTSMLIRTIAQLIEMASAFYTLYPGDIILTGTPEGVAPLAPGDALVLHSNELGTLTVNVAAV